MPLITCPDCEREISDAASACPGCGRPGEDASEPDETDTHRDEEKSANRELSLLALVTVLLVGARCFEIIKIADRLAGALDQSADYEVAIKNLFFETAPPPLLGLTSAWLYGGAWLGLVIVVLAITRARK